MLETAASLYHNGLNAETVLAIFDDMAQQVSQEAPRDVRHWETAKTGAYEFHLGVQRNRIAEEREASWIACIQAYCGADDADMKAAFPEFYQ